MKKFNWRVKRRREIELHARHVGAAATDDLPRWLIAWVWDNPRSKDQVGAVMECARRIGRKGFTAAEAQDVIEEAGATPRARKADDLACYLRLDYATRQVLGITMIGAHDADKRERRRRRRERNRLAKELKRRERGAIVRAEWLEANSISRAKPWEAEGISRITWYRRRKAARGTGGVTSPGTAEGEPRPVMERNVNCGDKVSDTGPGTAVFLKAADTPVSSRKEGLKRGRGDVGTCNQREVSPRGEKQRPMAVPGPVTPRKGGGIDEAA